LPVSNGAGQFRIVSDPATIRGPRLSAGIPAFVWAIFAVGAFVLGSIRFPTNHLAALTDFALGILWTAQALVSRWQVMRLIVPATIELSDAGIVIQPRPQARPTDVPWRDVRAVERSARGLLVTVAPMATNFTRDLPKRYLIELDAEDPRADAMWDLCYRHLVAPSGLRRSPGLRQIVNTLA
jgi:hypothetical protein